MNNLAEDANIKSENYLSSSQKTLRKKNNETNGNCLEKELVPHSQVIVKDTNLHNSNICKNFYLDILNRDLADIECRLHQTRLNWNKTFRINNNVSFTKSDTKKKSKKSLSMLDIKSANYLTNTSNDELQKGNAIEVRLDCTATHEDGSPEKVSEPRHTYVSENTQTSLENGDCVILPIETNDPELDNCTPIYSTRQQVQLFDNDHRSFGTMTSDIDIAPSRESTRNINNNKESHQGTSYRKTVNKNHTSHTSNSSVTANTNSLQRKWEKLQSLHRNGASEYLIDNTTRQRVTLNDPRPLKMSMNNFRAPHHSDRERSHETIDPRIGDKTKRTSSISSKRITSDNNHRKQQDIDDMRYLDQNCMNSGQLIDRMSILLGKPINGTIPRRSHISNTSTNESMLHNNRQKQQLLHSVDSEISDEYDDKVHQLKHMLLKQKVKWFADRAREESRRLKVQKLIELIETAGKHDDAYITDDLDTDSSTTMDSDNGERYLDYSDSQFRDKSRYATHFLPKYRSFRKDYYDSRNVGHHQQEVGGDYDKRLFLNKDRRSVELQANTVSHEDGDCQYNSLSHNQIPRSKISKSSSTYFDIGRYKSTNDRIRMKYGLTIADHRNMKNMKVSELTFAAGGLSWTIRDQRVNIRVSQGSYISENLKERRNVKSELQWAFENAMEQFILRSRQRQKRIILASERRRIESRAIRERAKMVMSRHWMHGLPRKQLMIGSQLFQGSYNVTVKPPINRQRSLAVARSISERCTKRDKCQMPNSNIEDHQPRTCYMSHATQTINLENVILTRIQKNRKNTSPLRPMRPLRREEYSM